MAGQLAVYWAVSKVELTGDLRDGHLVALMVASRAGQRVAK